MLDHASNTASTGTWSARRDAGGPPTPMTGEAEGLLDKVLTEA